MKIRYFAGGSALALALTLGGGALAQTAATTTADEPRTVDEIIVTAQKREQNLQDVPIVVTAVGEQQLEDAGVHDIKDLTILTPGLMVTSTSNETVTTARIRGIGTVGDNPGLESSVGVVVDGVYRPRNGVGFGDLGEMERIEVLKGPQGTLFGKNTSSGVINIITKRPEFTFGGEVELTAGNYDAIGGSVSVTGPIHENVAGRLYVARRERAGTIDVKTRAPRTNDEDFTQDFHTVRGQLLVTPTEDLDILFIGDFTKRDESCCLGVNLVRSPLQDALDAITPGGAVTNPPDPYSRVANANRSTQQKIQDKGASVQVDLDMPQFGGASLTSISAWRNWRTINGQDSDFSRADILYRNPDGSFGREFGQLSQELRLAGNTERFNWLIGGFLAHEDLDSREQLLIGTQYETYLNAIFAAAGGLSTFTGIPSPQYVPGTGSDDSYHQESDTWALFTNNSISFTDQLELTLGLRYTVENKELQAHYRNLSANAPCAALLAREAANAAILGGGNATAGRASTPYAILYGYACSANATPAFAGVDTRQEREEKEFSGTAKLVYRFNDDIMTYASYARGYKAGGFNLDRARTGTTATGFGVQPNTSFPGEFVDSYELGAKTEWLNNTLLANATVFHQTFEDFQLNTFTGISFIVASIPEVVSRGVDTDFLWFTPLDGFTLQGGVTYTETQYGDFKPTPGVSARLPNTRMSFAPLWSATTSASYERDIASNLMLRASVNAKYTSSYNTGSDLSPLKVQQPLTLVNGRVAIGSSDERWAVEFWGQNITDEDYLQVAFDATLQANGVNAFLGAPRTYGITLRSRW